MGGIKKEKREGTIGSPIPFATVITRYMGASDLNNYSYHYQYLEYAYHFYIIIYCLLYIPLYH